MDDFAEKWLQKNPWSLDSQYHSGSNNFCPSPSLSDFQLPSRMDLPLDEAARNNIFVKPYESTVGYEHVGRKVDTEISHMAGSKAVDFDLFAKDRSAWAEATLNSSGIEKVCSGVNSTNGSMTSCLFPQVEKMTINTNKCLNESCTAILSGNAVIGKNGVTDANLSVRTNELCLNQDCSTTVTGAAGINKDGGVGFGLRVLNPFGLFKK